MTNWVMFNFSSFIIEHWEENLDYLECKTLNGRKFTIDIKDFFFLMDQMLFRADMFEYNINQAVKYKDLESVNNLSKFSRDTFSKPLPFHYVKDFIYEMVFTDTLLIIKEKNEDIDTYREPVSLLNLGYSLCLNARKCFVQKDLKKEDSSLLNVGSEYIENSIYQNIEDNNSKEEPLSYTNFITIGKYYPIKSIEHFFQVVAQYDDMEMKNIVPTIKKEYKSYIHSIIGLEQKIEEFHTPNSFEIVCSNLSEGFITINAFYYWSESSDFKGEYCQRYITLPAGLFTPMS